jgi:hypothetical protein
VLTLSEWNHRAALDAIDLMGLDVAISTPELYRMRAVRL